MALWNQRLVLRDNRARIASLFEAVNRPGEMTLLQMMGLMALALEYRPNMILELGRLYGNSTCAFVEAANILGGDQCHVTSLCLTPNWDEITAPRLRAVVDHRWFQRLDALRQDILTFDYQSLLQDRGRVMVFWDAHGYAIANCVLGKILPLLSSRSHIVAVHDMSDARYLDSSQANYNGHSVWTRNDWSGRYVRLGWIQSNVEQAVALIDFASRNDIQLESATHSMRTELSQAQRLELDAMLGLEVTNSDAGWCWFSLNGSGRANLTFPTFGEPSRVTQLRTKTLMGALTLADKLKIERYARALAQALRRAHR
jgi:hypothetical protein